MLNDPHQRRCWSCSHEDTYRDAILPECACRKCGSADTRRLKSQAEKDAEAAAKAMVARQSAALAACEGMTTAQLTPGCVAKLVEALERIADIEVYGYGTMAIQSISIAKQALAAMKGE